MSLQVQFGQSQSGQSLRDKGTLKEKVVVALRIGLVKYGINDL
jgi:hypothetical protein